jgi:DNA topoisomerase-6 subunit A
MPKKKSAGPKTKQTEEKNVLSAIRASAEDIRGKIMARKKPTMKLPVRSLSNVRYQPQRGFFEMKGQKKERTLTVNTVKTFAQTLRLVALSKELV